MIDLSGLWHLSDETGQHSAPMTLPGDGISALRDAGVIPDPYVGRNEYDVRWVAERDWLLTRTFTLQRRDLVLVMTMLDTLADVSINGHRVLQADNMFRTHRVDVSDVVHRGENVITILFRSAPRAAAARHAAHPYPVPYQTENCPIPHGNMLRKPECDFGWDWNIALAPFGLYGDVRFEPAGARIADVIVAQDHAGAGVAVQVDVHTEGVKDGTEVWISLCGEEEQVTVQDNRANAQLHPEAPALWWPAGQGAQPLHDLVIQAGDFTATRRIGLRDIALVTTPDATGSGFAFHINGRPVFMKGANWIPADALPSAITPEVCRDLLQSAIDANMNMIRVWGGGRYEPDWFYDLCDEMGLLVWHDFMFACHLYPATDAFLADVAAEVREQVARLNHHACIALWCGDNEILGALTWYQESRDNRDRYLVAYDRLNRTIEGALRATAPTAIWWPSSPSHGQMHFSDAWHDDSAGDMHFWSVWHEGRDFDHYRDVAPRFCSEFGFQSYPSMDVIRRYTDPVDRNIASPVMESHQKNAGGNARIAETMFRTFRFPMNLEDFVYLSQIQQGLAVKTAITHWRSLKPHCMGTLYWQLNDTWPVCSWSSLDHGGGWKLLHHMARHFYAPLAVCAMPVPRGIDLKLVSDLEYAQSVEVTAHAVSMSGQKRKIASARVDSNPASALTALHIPADALRADDILLFDWAAQDGLQGQDHFAPRAYKAYALRPANVNLSVRQEGAAWSLTLIADALALFVAVEADVPGRFSDNAILITPDAPAQLTFTTETYQMPTFVLRDLHTATHAT